MKRFLMIMVATVVFSSAAYAQEVEPPVVAISGQLQLTPSQITLKRGETVTLRVTSTNRIERFSSKQLGFKVDIMPNQPRDITITPEKAGRFVASSDHVQMVINVE